MSQPTTNNGSAARRQIFLALADRRRRHILAHLMDQPSPVAEADLARHLVATDRGKSVLDITEDESQSRRTSLVHAQLPMLEEAGLVERDATAATVTTSNHPVFEDLTFRHVVETGVETDGWDDVLDSLASERRRTVLSVLHERSGPMARADLARAVAANETDDEVDPSSDAIEHLRISLHHHHLPKLADAELVEYDEATGTVAYTTHPLLEEVSTIIHSPKDRLAERFGRFFDGLGEAAPRTRKGRGTGEWLDWPPVWEDPHGE